jgi:hypothetical protein
MNPLDFVVTSPNPTVGVLFLPLATNQVTLSAVADGFGSVTMTPTANVYTNGQTVSLRATPGPGQQFVGWAGALSGSQNPVSLTLNGSQAVTAQFTRNLSLSVSLIPLQTQGTGARLSFGGQTGKTYEVQISPDLINWSTFALFPLTTDEAQFVDSAAGSTGERFFRVVQLP